MNITEYFSEKDDNDFFYRGRMTLRGNYSIVDADESCYRYVGAYSALPLTALAHPNDAAGVREALEKLDEGPQRLIFRMMSGNGTYRYMYAVIYLNGRVLDGEASIDVDFLDIMRIYYKFDADHASVGKYRKLMSLSDKMYFEYSYENGEAKIFEYVNDRGIVRFQDTLEHWQEKILESGEFDFGQKAEFESLQECLNKYAENMDIDMDGRLFGLGDGLLNLKGGIVYGDSVKQMMMAVVTASVKTDMEEKYYMSRHAFDSATSVYNKRAISELARDLLSDAGEKIIFLCVVDIDDFKTLNDTFGHLVGDEVIAKVAEVIKSTLGDRGYVGRFGGDEFLIVTDKIQTSEELIIVLKTIRKHIIWLCMELLGNVEVTTSIGIASYPKDAANYEELFKIADKCLYLAKAKGKNRFILYDEKLHKNVEMETVAGKPSERKGLDIYSKSCRAVVDILGNAGENNRESFDKSVRDLLSSYDIERMAIFMGEEYKRVYIVGEYEGFMDNLAFIGQPGTEALFDDNGIYAKNGILSIRETLPEFYKQLDQQGTKCFIIVKMQMPGQPRAAVMFEMCGHSRKWSGNEKGLLYIAAQVIVRRYFQLG